MKKNSAFPIPPNFGKIGGLIAYSMLLVNNIGSSNNFSDDSDLDILIDPTSETTLFDIGAIRHELLQLLGVRVDVLTPRALPESLRARVLAEARPV